MDPEIRGRGTPDNPANRFERMAIEPDPEAEAQDLEWMGADPIPPSRAPKTRFLRDSSRTVLSRNSSPDVGFGASVNPYRGCEHGCVYCYARPTHEYLGFSAGLDFETRILVKEDAPELLRRELCSPRWRPQVVAMSGVTDCYQPVERRLRLTRRCLEVLAEARNPVIIITKNRGITRDKDVLAELASQGCVRVCISLTTLDPELTAAMEPRTSRPHARLEAIRELTAAGVPVAVLTSPLIPGLTDHEVPSLLAAAAEAGATAAGYTVVRLPHGVKDLFSQWLERRFPLQKAKVLGGIEDLRGGRLNDPAFGSRMRGQGPHAAQIRDLFLLSCKKLGLNTGWPELNTSAFRRPAQDPGQMSWW